MSYRECPVCTFHSFSSHKTIATYAYTYAICHMRILEKSEWVNFLLRYFYSLLLVDLQIPKTAKNNKLLFLYAFPDCHNNLVIIDHILSYPFFRSKLVESPNILKKLISLPTAYNRLKALATARLATQLAKSKIISYDICCALTFYWIKKFFVCCCGDSLRISLLGENHSIHT